jgi:hypothetical protein
MMKRFLILTATLFFSLSCAAPTEANKRERPVVLILRFAPAISLEKAQKILQHYRVKDIHFYQMLSRQKGALICHVKLLPPSASTVENLNSDPNIEYLEFDREFVPQTLP